MSVLMLITYLRGLIRLLFMTLLCKFCGFLTMERFCYSGIFSENALDSNGLIGVWLPMMGPSSNSAESFSGSLSNGSISSSGDFLKF